MITLGRRFDRAILRLILIQRQDSAYSLKVEELPLWLLRGNILVIIRIEQDAREGWPVKEHAKASDEVRVKNSP